MKYIMQRYIDVLNQISHSWMILDYHIFFKRTLVTLQINISAWPEDVF